MMEGRNPGMGCAAQPMQNPGMGCAAPAMKNPGMGCGAQPMMNPGMGYAAQPMMNPGMGYTGQPMMNSGMGCGMGLNPQQAQARCQLMKLINEASFAMDDVSLFLDTHPNNMEALQYFKNVTAMRKNAMEAYQQQFGPLMIEDATGNNWSWVTEKWPWEGGC